MGQHTKHPDTPGDQRRRIFAFTGLPGSGKSTVAKEFSDFSGMPIVNMGEEMKAQYKALPVGDDRKDTPTGTWEMAQALRREHGPIGPALASVSRIAACFVENDIVVVDGVRNVAETELFEEVFGCPVHLIAVRADDETRLDRFVERGDFAAEYPDLVDEHGERFVAELEMHKRTDREVGEDWARRLSTPTTKS